MTSPFKRIDGRSGLHPKSSEVVSRLFRNWRERTILVAAQLARHWRYVLPLSVGCFVLINAMIGIHRGKRGSAPAGEWLRRPLIEADLRLPKPADLVSKAEEEKGGKSLVLKRAIMELDELLALQMKAWKNKGRGGVIAEMRKSLGEIPTEAASQPVIDDAAGIKQQEANVERFLAESKSFTATAAEREFAREISIQFSRILALRGELRAMDSAKMSRSEEVGWVRKALRKHLLWQGDAVEDSMWGSLETSVTAMLWCLTLLTSGMIVWGYIVENRKRNARRSIAHFVRAADAITNGKTSTRVSPLALGELREIAQAFNKMIDARQEAETRLQAAHQSLEFKVSARTAELWKANKALAEESERRLSAERDFLQGQKMEALGKLAGSIAHDFNNILTVIIGGAEFVRAKVSANVELASILKTVEKAGERAAELTKQMLTFSRNEILEIESVSLNAASQEAGEMLRRLLGVNIEVRMMLADDLRAVRANSSQIQQVLINLSVNARDAMEGNGILTITTKNSKVSEEAAARHGVAAREEWVELAVRDTGSGMDAPTVARIFEPFFTTKPKGKGTGFGLATVFGIVKQIGGFIEVETAVGNGSEFRVLIPAASADAGEATPKGDIEARTGVISGNETLLLVDDEEDIRELAAIILESCGYRVLSAPNAEDAIVLAEAHAGEIKGLITDVVMPGMSGVQLATILTRVVPGLCVLFVSGHSNESITEEILAATRGDYLQKPYLGETLAAKVRHLLERRNVIPVVFSPRPAPESASAQASFA